MKLKKQSRLWLVPGALALMLGVGGLALVSQDAEAGGVVGPDVTVIYLQSVGNWGSSGGIRGYSVGTTSCNIGNAPLWWCDDDREYCEDDQHPVIAQNLYRLDDGRFEQIGMSWLKHGFLSVNNTDTACGPSCEQPDLEFPGDQLGVGCTDPYGSGLNGSRPLGMRSEVDPSKGTFPFPYTPAGSAGPSDQRIKVADVLLDPALNPDARYWIEGHYIAADDASAGHDLNNASYREVSVEAGSFDLEFEGGTVREQAAIKAWSTVDSDVQTFDIDLGGGGKGSSPERFHAARKVTTAPAGWHYEYAIHNMNSDRAARGLSIQMPPGSVIENVGFKDIDHHSGEPWDTTDWTIDVDAGAGTVTWSTSTFAEDNNANALRWGTMFNFWFDASAAPGEISQTLEIFKPGAPSSVPFDFGAGSLVFANGFESGDTSVWD